MLYTSAFSSALPSDSSSGAIQCTVPIASTLLCFDFLRVARPKSPTCGTNKTKIQLEMMEEEKANVNAASPHLQPQIVVDKKVETF